MRKKKGKRIDFISSPSQQYQPAEWHEFECLDKLICFTVLSCISCCNVLLSWTSSTASSALSFFFLFYLALAPFSPISLSTSDNPPFSHFTFYPSLPFSVSISPSISHHAQLTFGVVWHLLNSYQNASPQLWLWILNKEPNRVRRWGGKMPALKDGWRGAETWLTRQMVINDS